jgi:hypothetical protein
VKEALFLDIKRMKLHAFHLRQIINSNKKINGKTIEDYTHLIWLINEKRQKLNRT